MTETQLLLFIATSLAVIITPGQDMVLVMSRGAAHGSRAGIITAAGVSTGLLGHTLLAGLGLGAILMTSDLIFSIIKYIGAAYLIYLGVGLIRSSSDRLELKDEKLKSPLQLFLTGAFSNISNPKITIFYFAYLPQFISADVLDPGGSMLMLGLSFSLMTFIVKGPVGYLAGRFSIWLKSRPSVIAWINRSSGTVLIALGIKLAFEKR